MNYRINLEIWFVVKMKGCRFLPRKYRNHLVLLNSWLCLKFWLYLSCTIFGSSFCVYITIFKTIINLLSVYLNLTCTRIHFKKPVKLDEDQPKKGFDTLIYMFPLIMFYLYFVSYSRSPVSLTTRDAIAMRFFKLIESNRAHVFRPNYSN